MEYPTKRGNPVSWCWKHRKLHFSHLHMVTMLSDGSQRPDCKKFDKFYISNVIFTGFSIVHLKSAMNCQCFHIKWPFSVQNVAANHILMVQCEQWWRNQVGIVSRKLENPKKCQPLNFIHSKYLQIAQITAIHLIWLRNLLKMSIIHMKFINFPYQHGRNYH